MEYIEQYKNEYKGETCAILCGGTSLPHDLRDIPEVDYFFGVNQHSLILPLDFLVFVDKKMWPYLKDYDCTFITRVRELQDSDKKRIIVVRQSLVHNYSGALALKAADAMGFDKIYVCGMDQYQKDEEDNRYYWWEGPQTPPRQKDRKMHDSPGVLQKFVKSLRSPQKVFFASGRMKELHQ